MADDSIDVRIRLQNARQFAADAALDAAAIRGVGAAAETTGRHVDVASRRSLLYSQALYTVRRGAFAATVALAGLATGATLMGIGFNSTMEQNTISLSHFLGSTQAATAELGTLYTLAAQTPFEFPQLTAAATRFLAFGFSLKETNEDLRVIGDTAAGLGAGAEGIERMVLVFGQMRATGRVLGNDLLQLAALGVPAMQILQKQLGLTAAQMQALGQGTLRIPSEIAIPALIRGLEERFHGLSRLQAQSFQGLVSTAHDYAAQLAGIATHPLFITLERDLRHLNPLLQQLGDSFKTGGWTGMIQTLDDAAGANGQFVTSWEQIRAAGQDLFQLLVGVGIPSLRLLWATVGLGSPPVRALIGLLGVATHHMTLLRIAVGLLVGRIIILRAATATATAITWGYTFAMKAGWVAMRAFYAAERVAIATQWALNVAMDANPIGLLIIGAVALGVGLAYLIIRVDAVRNALVGAYDWARDNWPLLLGILTGPVGLAAVMIVRHFDQVKDAVRGVLNWLIGAWNALHFTIGGWTVPIPGLPDVHVPRVTVGMPPIPYLAAGGMITSAGFGVIGDRGPELVSLPRGATVQPLTASASFDFGNLANDRPIHLHVHLGGREVAEEVFSYKDVVDRGVWGQVAFAGGRA